MTRQEFGAILFIGLSLLAGAVILIIQQSRPGFLPDLAAVPSASAGADRLNPSEPALRTTSATDSSETDAALQKPADALLSINAASLEALQRLPGIGPALARRIVSHRDRIGAFESLDQLLDVRGIGPVKLSRIKPHILPP